MFSEIAEIKSIREQKSKLSEREKELTEPTLTDLDMIGTLYRWFQEIISQKKTFRLGNVTQRKKFIFIILFLYSPSTLAKGYEERTSFAHGFPKLPVLYAYRSEPYCEKIKTFRVRLEKLLSNYADCIDYHFFPLLKLIGDVEGFMGKTKDRMVKLTGDGADAQYLTWSQVPDTIKFEAETLTNNAYDMSNTP